MPREIPRLLSDAEVAELLGVTIGTLAVWRCTRRYPLPFIKAGGRVRYSLADVERFLETRTIHPEAVAAR